MSEKPAGVYTRQVREMNEAAARSGKVFGVMFNQRNRGEHQKLKELVDSGELGEIVRTNYLITDWFRAQSYYDGGGWRATWARRRRRPGQPVPAQSRPVAVDLRNARTGARFRGDGQVPRHRGGRRRDRLRRVRKRGNRCLHHHHRGGAGDQSPGISGDRGKLLLEDGDITFWRTVVPVSRFRREWKGGFGSPEVWKCAIPAPASDQEHRE